MTSKRMLLGGSPQDKCLSFSCLFCRPVKDFEQLLMAPEPESVGFDGYAGDIQEEKPLLPELVLGPDMFKRALSRRKHPPLMSLSHCLRIDGTLELEYVRIHVSVASPSLEASTER